jgi:hypothetical protein
MNTLFLPQSSFSSFDETLLFPGVAAMLAVVPLVRTRIAVTLPTAALRAPLAADFHKLQFYPSDHGAS